MRAKWRSPRRVGGSVLKEALDTPNIVRDGRITPYFAELPDLRISPHALFVSWRVGQSISQRGWADIEQCAASPRSLTTRNPLQHRRQYPMAGCDCKFLPLDSLAFRCALPFNLLGRWRIRAMHSASWIGTNLYDVTPLPRPSRWPRSFFRTISGKVTAWRVFRLSLLS